MTTRPTSTPTEFTASSNGTRAAVLGLAFSITLGLLGALGQVADRQYDDALLAQVAALHWAGTVGTADSAQRA